jgi:hypothetical protein
MKLYFPIFILVGLMVLIQGNGFAQRLQKKATNPAKMNEFLDKQFYFGVRGGLTLTKAVPVERFSTFSSTTGESGLYDKKYHNFTQAGSVAGLELTYKYLHYSISFQPNYRRYRFSYENDYSWTDSTVQFTLDLNYFQDQKIDYIEFPLFVKYEFLQGAFKPFVQVGGYYGRMFNANKSITIRGKDAASGGKDFEAMPVIEDATDLFLKPQLGYALGLGLNWDSGNMRLIFDIVYRRNTHNITNRQNRYTHNRLAGSGDALDDVKLRAFSFNIACVFPMRFLNASNYKTSNKN